MIPLGVIDGLARRSSFMTFSTRDTLKEIPALGGVSRDSVVSSRSRDERHDTGAVRD
jgi:hypothetical protein